MYRIRSLAIVAALAASLVLPAATFAATSPETIQVANATSLTGAPTGIDYGIVTQGTFAPASAAFDLVVNTTSPGGATLTVSGNALTDAASDVIPASARGLVVGSDASVALPKDIHAVQGANTFTLLPNLQVPMGTLDGIYHGTMTFAVAAD